MDTAVALTNQPTNQPSFPPLVVSLFLFVSQNSPQGILLWVLNQKRTSKSNPFSHTYTGLTLSTGTCRSHYINRFFPQYLPLKVAQVASFPSYVMVSFVNQSIWNSPNSVCFALSSLALISLCSSQLYTCTPHSILSPFHILLSPHPH